MDQYAGRLLADRYRLPRPPSEVFELVESRAFDTASGQEVLVRQVPLPEVVDAELLDGEGRGPGGPLGGAERATRTPDDPVVRRALEAAAATAALPDHARLDQIFDVFVQGDGLWIVSELVPARPLAAILAEQRLTPYRAAEVAADLLAALRVVHAHGWAHRNITARTVLICDDGRALLTGLAAGAAEEVLCGYDPFPLPAGGSGRESGGAAGTDPGAAPAPPGAEPSGGVRAGVGPSAGDPSPGHPSAVGPSGDGPSGGDPAAGTGPDPAVPATFRPAAEPRPHGAPGPAEDGYAAPGPGVPGTGPGGAPGRPELTAGAPAGRPSGPGADPAGGLPAGPRSLPHGWHAEPGTRPGPGPAAGAPPWSGPGAGMWSEPGAAPGAAPWSDADAGPRPGPGAGSGGEPGGGPGGGPSGQGGDSPGQGLVARVREQGGAYPGPHADRPGPEDGRGPGSASGSREDPAHPEAPGWPDPYRPDPYRPEPYRPEPGRSGFDRSNGYRPEPHHGGPQPEPQQPEPHHGDPHHDRPHQAEAYRAEPRPADPYRPDGRPAPDPEGPGTPPRGYRPPTPPPGTLPASWDFESGERPPEASGGRAALAAARAAEEPAPPRRPEPASPAAVERASRFGAIAAYRAGTRAGAEAVNGGARRTPDGRRTDVPGHDGRGPAGPGGPGAEAPGAPGGAAAPALPAAAPSRGSGPTELPGTPRPSRAVTTGWESEPPRAPVPARRTGARPARSGEPAGDSRAVAATGASAVAERGRPPAPQQRPPGTGIVPDPSRRYRGPDSALAAERARQARMTTVGAVTERWAPEQAGPVYDHWRLAPPVGPAADLWALGALLFRAVQGHPPYPEDDAAELTQAVCAEQPAFAEECGALRPVVESLLRQDPTERPSPEELRGWLRSIIRSAPEPEVGRRTVTAPPMLEAGRPADPARLPIVRHRGELVSRRRREESDPRRLGRVLLVLTLFLVAGGMAYAMLFMSEPDPDRVGRAGPAAEPTADATPGESGEPGGDGEPDDSAAPSPPADDPEDAPVPEGFEAVEDPAGFRLTVPEGWERRTGDDGQVVFSGDGLRLVVVPGRDGTGEFGDAAMEYQLQHQPELADYRKANWRSSGSLQTVRVGNVRMADGTFVWDGGDGREFARNRAMLIDDAYHVVMLRGPESRQDETGELYETVAHSYRVTGG